MQQASCDPGWTEGPGHQSHQRADVVGVQAVVADQGEQQMKWAVKVPKANSIFTFVKAHRMIVSKPITH